MKCANKLVLVFCCSFYALISACVSPRHCGFLLLISVLQLICKCCNRKLRRLFQNLGHLHQIIEVETKPFHFQHKQTSLFGWLLSCKNQNDLDTNHICILKCKPAKDLQHWHCLSEVSRCWPAELSGCNFGHWRVEYTIRAVAEILKDSSSWC